MSGLFKWIIFTCVTSEILGITSVRDDANWFKNGHRLKDKFVTGVVNGIFDVNCDESVNGTSIQGECMSKGECLKRKGKVGGACSLLGVCCVIEKTCTNTTSTKLSYFVTPTTFQSDCPLTIKIANKDVCQLRLDFEEFEIAQPTSKGEGDQMIFSSYQCQTDSFKVEQTPRNLGFTSLCGKNKGQHLYVPVVERQDTVVLRFHLKTREANNLVEPKWKIKIRQLECQNRFLDQHLTAPSKLMALYHSLKNKKHRHKSDYDLIAPPNCLQYYPERSGKFESFNYNNGDGVYIGPMDYAICFRKSPDACAVKYTADTTFQMNFNAYQAGMPPDDKCHPKAPASPRISQDYIVIPGGVNAANEFQDYYCNTDFNALSNTAVANSVKPLYLGVHTDEFRVIGLGNENDFKETGFRLIYEVVSGNC